MFKRYIKRALKYAPCTIYNEKQILENMKENLQVSSMQQNNLTTWTEI